MDATHGSRKDRSEAFALAVNCGIPCLLVEVVAGEDAVRRNFEARASEPSLISDARWETYRHQQSAFDPIDEISVEEHITVDGTAPLSTNIDAIIAQVASLAQR